MLWSAAIPARLRGSVNPAPVNSDPRSVAITTGCEMASRRIFLPAAAAVRSKLAHVVAALWLRETVTWAVAGSPGRGKRCLCGEKCSGPFASADAAQVKAWAKALAGKAGRGNKATKFRANPNAKTYISFRHFRVGDSSLHGKKLRLTRGPGGSLPDPMPKGGALADDQPLHPDQHPQPTSSNKRKRSGSSLVRGSKKCQCGAGEDNGGGTGCSQSVTLVSNRVNFDSVATPPPRGQGCSLSTKKKTARLATGEQEPLPSKFHWKSDELELLPVQGGNKSFFPKHKVGGLS